MLLTPALKKALDQYYKELLAYSEKKVTHETALRSAFQSLLAIFAQSVGWTLIPEQTLANGKRPDATLRDDFTVQRGHWEAKDTKDDLETEIRKKIALGYPTRNIIFEDTRRAVLVQEQKRVFEADLSKRSELIELLDRFIHFTEAHTEQFLQAVEEFKASIPDLANGLLERIAEEHSKNKSFASTFNAFLEQCRQSLDPTMSRATVDEMLVQHLLTERLFRTVFDNPDFVTRNVIAAEMEKVIQALTSRSFNRHEFLKRLDHFYLAIENEARTLNEWKDKQDFLNTVYERFFQGFSVKQADTHGIVYTPQELVDFMVASVDVILRREFNVNLSTPGVQILDPCVGTGNFIVNLLQRISGGTLAQKYANDLFCNEIMLLPYYIATLNIEHAYYARTQNYQPFEGIAFADSLNLEGVQREMELFSERNTTRIVREKAAPIMVVIGNPPYNVGQRSENDNNKNKRYEGIDKRVSQTYAKDSQASNKNALSDMYVKFFRWAVDRLQGRDGIVCFVSNNSFVDQIAFDGMRKNLLRDFNLIYHLDLHGNVRKNPKLSGTTHNVFGIQVGVGITIAVRATNSNAAGLYYYRVPEDWRKTEKLAFLVEKKSLNGIDWQKLAPDERNTWITEGLQADFNTLLPIGMKEAKSDQVSDPMTIFKNYGRGVATCRDIWAYDYHYSKLVARMQRFVETYNNELDRWQRRGSDDTSVDNFVLYDDTKIKWSRDLKLDLQRGHYAKFAEDKIRKALYRPFCKQWLFFDRILNEEVYQLPQTFPMPLTEEENTVICLSGVGSSKPFHCLVANCIPDLHLTGDSQCFPYYTYSEDGTNRRENITGWALQQFQAQYGAQVTKRDIFAYVYALLHHPSYRTRYAENLKRDLPHIPLVESADAFATCVRIGQHLIDLHLTYEQAQEYPLEWVENRDVPINWRVEKLRLAAGKDAIQVNDWLRLEGIPQDCYRYRLGNRSALEWVIDQYQVSEDKRSGIVSDPNREDDPQYIVRLIGRIITVSLETVRLIDELAAAVNV